MLIKVCGMKNPENIRQINVLPVDWIGFVFYSRSPRYAEGTEKEAKLLQTFLSGYRSTPGTSSPRYVGVFVNDTAERMMETARLYRLDYLQLHGNESPEFCHTLQKRGYSLIKAFSVSTVEDLKRTEIYEGRADYFLFDTACTGYGGSGRSFDWEILNDYTGKTPFLLSGGINPQCAESIRRFTHPRLAGIDLNSGFESSPGVKDTARLREFIEKIKRTDKSSAHE